MKIKFSADEILSVAEKIERNGARFYRRAAELQPDHGSQQLLNGLAEMEEQHQQTFARMRSSLTEAQRQELSFDPDNELDLYLQSMADGHVFDADADPAALLGPGTTLESVYRTAIGMEKESVVFYQGVKGVVPESLGQGWVEAIIKEEMGHVGLLSANLALVRTK